MTIPQEAIEAAGRRLMETNVDGLPLWDTDLDDQTRDYWRDEGRTAITAALPALEQQIRAQVAQEIRRECDVLSSSTVSEYVVIHVKTGLERAARIARGEQA
ncbi:hypothetical protein [Timonella senegalensis]|uniref:hypothetical protein n=1 Tax=Timonella senegalensis TaxID=1465825 RepID=UPI002FDD1457